MPRMARNVARYDFAASWASRTWSPCFPRKPLDGAPGSVTQTVTLRQLEDSLAAISKTLAQTPLDDAAMSAKWVQLAKEGATLTDIADAIALESRDEPESDLLYWSRAIERTIAEHRVDLDSVGDVGARARPAARARRYVPRDGDGDGFRIPVRHSAPVALDRLLDSGIRARSQLLRSVWRPRRGSRASSRSPRATCRPGIGSGSAARRRRWRAASALISWSGSMFEYLMPPLVMRAPAGSLLEQTDRLVVRRQIEYGADAWVAVGDFRIRLQCARSGIHLSIFQFRRAGPRTETRIGREQSRRALCDGLGDHGRSLRRRGRISSAWRKWARRGRYGFYEAVDFTPTRVQEGEPSRSSAPSWRIIRA